MPQLHEYPVHVDWNGGRDGNGQVSAKTSGTTVNLAVPPEYQGPGGASNPEELLTSAIASCYTITFGIVSGNRKLPVQAVSVDAVGFVEQQGANIVFRKVEIRPTITLSADATEQQVAAAEDVAHKSDAYCLVTNAVRGKVEVVVEPTILKAEA